MNAPGHRIGHLAAAGWMVLLLLLLLALPAVHANTATPLAADPALEARVLQLSDELRCLVCQNETIAASQAALAVDLRQQIRQQLQKGRSDAQVLDFMVQRYGDFVRYRPAFKASTLLLWLGPFVLLALAGAALFLSIRGRQQAAALPVLDAMSARRASALLGEPAVRS